MRFLRPKPTTPEPSPLYGTLPWESPTDLEATLDRLAQSALAGLPPFALSPMIADPNRPSSVRVFAKSLHVLVAGWVVSLVWLWGAGLRQNYIRDGFLPANYGLPLLLFGIVSGIALEACAVYATRKAGAAPRRNLELREWHHAFWWCAVPNVLLLGTAYLMIVAAY